MNIVNALIKGSIENNSYQYKNVVIKGNVSLLSLLAYPNTKYTIRNDFDLNGGVINLPFNSILAIDGGSISNGSLIGNDSVLLDVNQTGNILLNVLLLGSWKDTVHLDSITVGEIKTGSNPNVTITGDSHNAILNITFPETSSTTPITNYNSLIGKPLINNVELTGSKSLSDLGIIIPTKVSDLLNDSNFISGFNETDPTVPSWAKLPNKPTYTALEVGALSSSVVVPSTQDIRDAITVTPLEIENGVAIATVNGVTIKAPTAGAATFVLSDWNETNSSDPAYILNKPDITQSVVTESTVSGWGFTKNTGTYSKPSLGIPMGDLNVGVSSLINAAVQPNQLATVATSGSYNDLINKPTIPNLSDYLPTTGGTLTGELTIDTSSEQESATPLTLRYNSYFGSSAIRINDVYSGRTNSFTFPSNKDGELAVVYSPNFLGSPTSTNPSSGDNSNRIATTKFVNDAIALAEFDVDISNELLENLIGRYVDRNVTNIINVMEMPSGGNESYYSTSNITEHSLSNIYGQQLSMLFMGSDSTVKIYPLVEFTPGEDDYPALMIFSTTLFNKVSATFTVDKFIFTRNVNDSRGYNITRNLDSMIFSFNSTTSTLNISTI